MSRVSPKSIPKEDLRQLLNELWVMIASLETKEEVENFFRDLLSETEALMLARHIRIARLLLQGMTYEDIAEILHASDGTIAGVHRWLQSGSGGYKDALPRLEANIKAKEKQSERTTPYSFEWLKKRYPLHFLLFNVLDEQKIRVKQKK